ncbi:MAG TPA: amidohydrolase [Gemmatimonadales bacterium]|nr:amidohydrolase [Gemmatimonadales bacterium]
MSRHWLVLAAALAACGGERPAPAAGDAPAGGADRIFVNGHVLTMNDAQPEVEALAVTDGKIVALGTTAEVEALKGATTTVTDLGGKTLLPGFIDAHGHIVDYTAQWTSPNLSPPPVGEVRSIADIQAKLTKYLADARATPDRLVVAMGYDDGLLKEKRHPTRAELDRVSSEIPILIVHASGHLAVANSPALAKVGYTKATKNPPGGVIRRDRKTGEPDGVLEEKAVYPFMPLVPRLSADEQLRTLDAVQQWYASYGVTTAQDGLSNPANLALLRDAASQHRLILDIVSYPMWTLFDKVIKGEQKLEGIEYYPPGSQVSNAGRGLQDDVQPVTPASFGDSARTKLKVGLYENGLKIGGIKISADGSPQGKTAFMTKPYLHPPAGQPADYRAYPVVPQAEMDQWFDAAYRHDLQLIVHTNGDAAIDELISAVSKARATHGPKDLRPVAIHAQLARRDQVDSMAALGIVPSFFTAHTFFWGDWHINETFGRERAFGISPLAYATSKGLRFSNHNDAPVVPPDMLLLAWTAVNRLSRSGVVVGPDERVPPLVALKAMTIWAAYQNFEEDSKGSLEPGKRADLVVLSDNPLTVKPEAIKDIAVVETVKDGRTIYTAAEGKPAGPAR